MVSENKIAKVLLKKIEVLYDLSATAGDSPLYSFFIKIRIYE